EYVHPDELAKAQTPAQRERRAALQKQTDELNKRLSAMDARNMAYIGQFTAPDPVFVLKRGDVMQRMDEVSPGALSACTALPGDLVTPSNAGEAERRLALAKWLCDSKNPLTARVIVNRVWQHHFGRGIVGTPSDFGRNGEKPTQPELLDWLAAEFARPIMDVWKYGSNSAASTTSTRPYLHTSIPSAAWTLKR